MTRAEQLFYAKIDCRFPYNDRSKTSALIEEAIQLSDNSVFQIIDEIARIPHSERAHVSTDRLEAILQEIQANYQHPLLASILDIATKMVHDTRIACADALKIMESIKAYTGLWGALMTVNEACEDEEGKVDAKYDEIRAFWNKDAGKK